MAEDRPQGSAVVVGTGVWVGVSVGVTVTVLVGAAVWDLPGVTILSGALQPAIKDRNKIQEMSFVIFRLGK